MKINTLSVLILSTFLAVTSCGTQTHTIKDGWENDETSHWHDCTGCDEILDKENHTYGDWKTIKEPTCTEKGQKEKTCSVCNYKVVEDIAPIGHKASDKWSFDLSYHWHECLNCGEMLDRTEHTFTDWKITKEPTCNTKGLMERTCTICNYKVEEVIPELGHQWKDEWFYDENNHWHECARDNHHRIDYEEHTFEDRIIKQPTCEESGLLEKVCKCGYKYTEELPPIKHKFTSKNIQNITINSENPVKIDVFCANDSSHKLEFSLPSINSGAYNHVASHNGSCKVDGATTSYMLKDNAENRESFKDFTDKISNPNDFYSYIFGLKLNTNDNQVLDKHFKLVGYELISEPTFDDYGQLDLICECGERVQKVLPPLSFCFYDAAYKTGENPKTIFTTNGIDATYECEQNFIYYEDIFNELQRQQYVFEMEGIPAIEMLDKEFITSKPTEILFKYDDQPFALKIVYATFDTERDKFIEKVVLEDNPNAIGKIAKREVYIKYNDLLTYLNDVPGIKNHPDLKTVVETTPYYVYANQSRSDIEHLLPQYPFKDYDLVEPTLEATGTLTINSTESYNEVYVLPKLNSEYYDKTTANGKEYFSLKPEAITTLLNFSIFNENSTLIDGLKNYKFNEKNI